MARLFSSEKLFSSALNDGDVIELGNRSLEIIHTPGEAPNHICILDRKDRILFSGDMLLKGPIWTHLEGGNLNDLENSFKKRLVTRIRG